VCSILIVDDEEPIREITSSFLEEQKYTTYKTSNALDAIKLCKLNDDIGIVLTDINLGREMDGISLITRLREINPKIIILMMTGYINEYPIDFCMSLGIRDILYKPFSNKDLLEVINCTVKYRKRHLNKE
jgi:CheY-like chemotaxis protein